MTGAALLCRDDTLLPELAPKPPESQLQIYDEDIQIRWLGHIGRTHRGIYNILRGVDAIRGFCISSTVIIQVRVKLNGLPLHQVTPKAFPLRYEKHDSHKKKYVFNIWHDFSNFREGLHEIRLEFLDENGGLRFHSQKAAVLPPLRETDYPTSDRLVTVSSTDSRPLDEQVNSRPSIIRRATRKRFETRPRSVLIQRVDQLGDMVISIPALTRMRQLLPDSRLVGLCSFANVELAKTIGVFDDLIAIDFPDDEWERRRIISLEKQY